MRKPTAAANGIGEQRYVFVMVGRVGKDQTKERKRERKRMGARERRGLCSKAKIPFEHNKSEYQFGEWYNIQYKPLIYEHFAVN